MLDKNSLKNDRSYKQELIKISKNAGIGGSTIIIGNLINYLIIILATRTIGAEGFGIFFLGYTILLTATLFSLLGLGQSVLRFVSLYEGTGDNPRIKGTILFCLKRSLLASSLIAVAIFILTPLLADIFNKPVLKDVQRILIFALPFAAITEICLASLQGLRFVAQNALVRNVWIPLTRLLLLAVFIMFGLKLQGLLFATVLSVLIGFAISFALLYKKSLNLWKQTVSIFEKTKIIKFSTPIFFDDLFTKIISVLPILMLGYFFTSTDVGIYGVGLRLGLIVSLPLNAFNLIFAPTISNLYGRGEKESLARLFKVVTKWVFTISFPITLFIFLFAKPILSIFGSAFVVGAAALYFIVLGELVNAGVGSVGYILMMTGRPKINLINSIILFFLTLGLGFLLISKYGILGAALTTAISVTFINILRLIEVYYFERIHPYNRNFAKPVIAGVLAVTAVFAFKLFIPSDNIIYDLIGSLVFCLIFTSTLLVLKLEEEDLFILNLIGRKLRFASL